MCRGSGRAESLRCGQCRDMMHELGRIAPCDLAGVCPPPPKGLPPPHEDWTTHVDPKTKRFYQHNMVTEETRWV